MNDIFMVYCLNDTSSYRYLSMFLPLCRVSPTMDSLVAVGMAAAFAAGAILGPATHADLLEAPVMLLAVILLGRTLEARARSKMGLDVAALTALIPEQARLVGSAESVTLVPTAALRPGDTVRVLPGEAVPLDGTVLSGRASTDDSLVTGESR